jgi:DUF2934 family protein
VQVREALAAAQSGFNLLAALATPKENIMAIAKPQPRKETTPTIDMDERIRLRAFQLFELRGREDGHDLDDWVAAETEILGRPVKLANLRVVK